MAAGHGLRALRRGAAASARSAQPPRGTGRSRLAGAGLRCCSPRSSVTSAASSGFRPMVPPPRLWRPPLPCGISGRPTAGLTGSGRGRAPGSVSPCSSCGSRWRHPWSWLGSDVAAGLAQLDAGGNRALAGLSESSARSSRCRLAEEFAFRGYLTRKLVSPAFENGAAGPIHVAVLRGVIGGALASSTAAGSRGRWREWRTR